jgi:hypothetical protein
MCADGSDACYEDAVGECPECGGKIDKDGASVEECCNYCPESDRCPVCGYAPCTGYC